MTADIPHTIPHAICLPNDTISVLVRVSSVSSCFQSNVYSLFVKSFGPCSDSSNCILLSLLKKIGKHDTVNKRNFQNKKDY